jgi:hypothetical protein
MGLMAHADGDLCLCQVRTKSGAIKHTIGGGVAMDIFMQIMWFGTGIAIIVAGVFAGRSRLARYVGRVALFVLFAIAGALMHFIALMSGLEKTDFYVTFADTAHFDWVNDAWQAVFVPNQAMFVALLAVFELIVGVLIISGGRRTQVGLMAAIAFHLALWLFGGIQLAWTIVMLPFLVLLLRAEWRAGAKPTPASPSADRSAITAPV